jgi:hypothetical protein
MFPGRLQAVQSTSRLLSNSELVKISAIVAAILLAHQIAAVARVAVLRFGVVPVGMTDEVLPTQREIDTLTHDLRAAVGSRADVEIVAVPEECFDALCALHAARKVHATRVIYGQVTRYMALLWALQLESVDVRTQRQKVSADLYKGDFLALEHAIEPAVHSVLK